VTTEAVEVIEEGSSFATLLAFWARFLRAAANEELLLEAEEEEVGAGVAAEAEGGRLIDDEADLGCFEPDDIGGTAEKGII